MVFLHIVATNGTQTYIPDNAVISLTLGTETRDAGSNYRAPNIIRGKITGAKYYDGLNGVAATVKVDTVAAYVSGSTPLYEYGVMTVDGAFSPLFNNIA